MAVVEIRTCDVYGVRSNVRPFRLSLTGTADDGTAVDILDRTVDLCPQASDRLVRAIERCLTPPKSRTASD